MAVKAVKAHRVVRRRGSHISLNNSLTDGGEVELGKAIRNAVIRTE
jgi:hypothetical protein